jgi:flagellar basal body-associated protein FliL
MKKGVVIIIIIVVVLVLGGVGGGVGYYVYDKNRKEGLMQEKLDKEQGK